MATRSDAHREMAAPNRTPPGLSTRHASRRAVCRSLGLDQVVKRPQEQNDVDRSIGEAAATGRRQSSRI